VGLVNALGNIQASVEGPVLRALLGLPPPVLRVLAGRPIVRDGLVLDLDMQAVLRIQRLIREPDLPDLSIAKARRALVRQAGIVGGVQPIGEVVDRHVEGPGGDLPIRVYVPSAAPTTDACLLFFHGGAWVYGGLDSHDALCRVFAEQAGVRVVAVDYRLAPEHPFPAAVEDALAAYDWVRAHGADIGVDPGRIVIGGDSAGGNLATVVARERRDAGPPLLQLLIYPTTRVRADTRSMQLFNAGFYLSQAFMDVGFDNYVPADVSPDHPRLSPLLADDVVGMCPAYIVTAGFDPLRDEGEAYAERLSAAGVEVEARRFDGLIHSFANMVGVGTSAPAAVREITTSLSRRLAKR
jgi:acetyl esterase